MIPVLCLVVNRSLFVNLGLTTCRNISQMATTSWEFYLQLDISDIFDLTTKAIGVLIVNLENGGGTGKLDLVQFFCIYADICSCLVL